MDDTGETGYLQQKSQKLLEFGADKVIWILSKPKQVIIATAGGKWQVLDWNNDVELIENHTFNIGRHFAEEGINPDLR